MSITLTKTGKTFITDGVKIGDELVIKTPPVGVDYVTKFFAYTATGAGRIAANGFKGKFYVTSVDSETTIKYDGFINGVAQNLVSGNLDDLVGSGTVGYEIVHTYTKDEQVDLLIALAKSFDNKRVIGVVPGTSVWEDENGNDVELGGEYTAAAFAAAVSAYPAQQSFTNLRFTGPKELKYSNRYFTPAQLNRLSDGGLLVLVQDAVGGQVYARHQKTTSAKSIQEAEFSIVKAVDKVSIDLHAIVKKFIGLYNITPDLLTQIEDNLTKYLFNAKNDKKQYCGGLIIGFKSLSLRANLEGQNEDLQKGVVEISLEVEVGYPFNYAPIKLYVK